MAGVIARKKLQAGETEALAEIRDDGNITISVVGATDTLERCTLKTAALLLLASLGADALHSLGVEASALQAKGPRR